MVTHQLQVERRTGKVCQSETDVLPLCYATNQGVVSAITVFGGGRGVGGDKMSDHMWCLGVCVCAEISCPPRQLNGGYIEGY